MIRGRNLFTGQLVYCTGTPICRSCWNGFHHRCKVQADEWNKCECAEWGFTKAEHAESVAAKRNLRATEKTAKP